MTTTDQTSSRSRRGLIAGTAGVGAVAALAAAVAPTVPAHAEPTNPKDARHIRTFGVVGDGVANDTAAVNAAFLAAIEQKLELYSDPGTMLLVDEVTVAGGLALSGTWNFKARTSGQNSVINLTGQVDWSRASVTIHGEYRARYGLKAHDCGRSQFGAVTTERCQVWGWQFDPSGNNNLVAVARLAARICGTHPAHTLTQTAETTDVATSRQGYGTFSVSPALPATALLPEAVYFVTANGRPYRVKAVTATTIEVFNLRAASGVGGSVAAEVLIGGGLNLVKHGDNGVGLWSSIDVSSCSVAVQHSSLYGHQFDNLVCQANVLGVTSADYTIETVLTKPYFEQNMWDIVSHNYIKGVVLAPVMALTQTFNIGNAIDGNPSFDRNLVIVQDQLAGLRTDVPPKADPGAREVRAGQVYHFHRSASGPWTFTIDNRVDLASLGAYGIQIDLSHNPGAVGALTIALSTANGQTIEGSPTYTANVTGRTAIRLWRVGTTWRVQLTGDRLAHTSTAQSPSFVGQLAVVNGAGYLAVGTASPADWKLIT